ncbi:alkaline phosphatase family protein [Halocatena salina]|uniref:Alkaline phosphatase family protein n=1 Tax=Halocatena salina TaxID=2934340 RepID=A0A8U0A4K8_9EURY|nr:alkaline phosphatase family protein [Halocatena salina]UPM42883.1 alkaline phosphatase family protein [Halocatena salina]
MAESSNETRDLQTLLIGIDAGCRSVLEPLFDQNQLPNLQRLFGGASGALESQIPPWTASAWPSLYTGTNPGKHGVFDFLAFEGYEWSVVNATHVRRRSLWEYLDNYGYRSVVVNVPITHPPRPFDGALVPGYTAPESPECHPPGLFAEIEDAIGEYHVYGTVESATECVRMRGDAFRYLVDRFEPDFGFVEFQWTDAICHKRPGDWGELERVYGAVDRQIGEILDFCSPRNVIVVSDHGMGPYNGRTFLVNEYLDQQGYVQTTNGGDGMPSWSAVRDQQLKRGVHATRYDASLIERLTAGAARFGMTSQRIESILSLVGLKEFVLRHVPTTAISTAAQQVDFPRSRAYMRSRTELGVRINLQGREPGGIVPPGKYESVRSDLIDRLQAVETPTGDPVFESVVRREQQFSGPFSDQAPDIITIPADFDQFLSTQIGTQQFSEPNEPWNHKRDGIVAAHGESIDETASLTNAHLFDVTPTVLATFDVPADVAMDGRVLPIVDSAGDREYPPFELERRKVTTNRSIEDRLADLGYIE